MVPSEALDHGCEHVRIETEQECGSGSAGRDGPEAGRHQPPEQDRHRRVGAGAIRDPALYLVTLQELKAYGTAGRDMTTATPRNEPS